MFALYISVLILNVIVVRGDCNFEFLVAGQNVSVLRRVQNYYFLSTSTNFNMINDEQVHLVCPSEFTTDKDSLDYLLNDKKVIGLGCRNGVIYHASTEPREIDSNSYYAPYIYCQPGNSSFYTSESEECTFTNLLYGFKILDVPIVLAEFCYDLDAAKCDYAHFVVGKKSSYLANLEKSNPTLVNNTELDEKQEVFLKQYLSSNTKLNSGDVLVRRPFKDLLFEIYYTFDELAPSNLYLGHFKDTLVTLNPFMSIPWWIPLKTGNWKIYESVLSKETKEKNFEIYAGQSHVASYPDNFVCDFQNEMKLDVNGGNDVVPLYIWNYIIPRNRGEEFVIIAINSPFAITSGNNTMVLCEDMCDEVKWLKLWLVTRKVPTFGYMFCCRPMDVYKKLDGFPKYNLA